MLNICVPNTSRAAKRLLLGCCHLQDFFSTWWFSAQATMHSLALMAIWWHMVGIWWTNTPTIPQCYAPKAVPSTWHFGDEIVSKCRRKGKVALCQLFSDAETLVLWPHFRRYGMTLEWGQRLETFHPKKHKTRSRKTNRFSNVESAWCASIVVQVLIMYIELYINVIKYVWGSQWSR